VFYAVGTNQYDIDGKGTSLHAEMDAVQKLKDYSRLGFSTKKPKKVIAIVFRVNNAGTRIMMSKPCHQCIAGMKRELERKNYKLHKGWYSTDEGKYEKFNII
jgi:hypothetical protein|tara:strand:- start:1017 stop:1322 length:306 start_codon:yes stop_codon:yes gene_type:complete